MGNGASSSNSKAGEAKPPPGITQVNDNVWQLHNPGGDPIVEIIFFHGLQLGDYENSFWKTWVARADENVVWPKDWLGEMFPKARILTISYDWAARNDLGQLDLYCLGENLVFNIIKDSSLNIGQCCPVILVGHCVGGLVIKQFLLSAVKEMNEKSFGHKIERFLQNLKGVFYYATPHAGSEIVNLAKSIFGASSQYVQLLETHDDKRQRNNEEFRRFCEDRKTKTYAIGESLPTTHLHGFNGLVVGEASARHYVNQYYTARAADHFDVCKPEDRKTSGIFTLLRDFISAALNEVLDDACYANKQRLPRAALSQTPVTLHFLPDRKDVPLQGPFTEVQKALEDGDGACVVTVHGVAGMGKTSLVKYVALHYHREPETFPDGVYYLDCGKGAENRVEQLRLALLDDLRCGGGSAGQSSESRAAAELRFRLAQRKLLIVIDDVWETEVLEKFLVHEAGLKYLVSSQFKEIWPDAEKIKLRNPDRTVARKIMANHTRGLQPPGEFPDSIESQTDVIIRELHYHPLSLAHVGILINEGRATDPQEWEAAKKKILRHVHVDDFTRSPMAYGRRYPHTVDTSMMLMVDSLPPVAKRFLWVMALLWGEDGVPEEAVKYFYTLIERTNSKRNYNSCVTELEDRSLLTLHCHPQHQRYTPDGQLPTSRLALHGLRAHILRERNGDELRSMVTNEILGSSSGSAPAGPPPPMSFRGLLSRMISGLRSRMISLGGAPPSMQSEDPASDGQTFATIMAAMYFQKSFIPRMTNKDMDVIPLNYNWWPTRQTLEPLLWLVNPGEGEWRQQAGSYARKVLMRFVVRGELDDQSMARLIQLPHTTLSACQALRVIIGYLFRPSESHWLKLFAYQNRTFSKAYGETMESLMTLLHDNATTTAIRVAVIRILAWILPLESEDSIVKVARKWVELLATDSNPAVQSAILCAIHAKTTTNSMDVGVNRKSVIIGEFPGILEGLLMLAGQENHSENLRRDRTSDDVWALSYLPDVRTISDDAWDTLSYLTRGRTNALRMMTILGAAEMFFERFLLSCSSYPIEQFLPLSRSLERQILLDLSSIPDNRVRLRGLLNGLTRLRCEYHRENHNIAQILGNLALTNEIRETIVKIPHVHDWFRQVPLHGADLQNQGTLNEMTPYEWGRFVTRVATMARAKTILDPLNRNPPEADATVPLVLRESASYGVYQGRMEAFQDMKRYPEALVNIGAAYHHLQLVENQAGKMKFWLERGETELFQIRQRQVFLKTMTEDYEGAILDADDCVNSAQEVICDRHRKIKTYCVKSEQEVMRDRDRKIKTCRALVTRGVLRRLCEHFAEALADLDNALSIFTRELWVAKYIQMYYDIHRHRGFVKWLMEDEVGARADAEVAQDLKSRTVVWETSRDAMGPFVLTDLPVNYLGFALQSLGGYSLD